MYINKREAELLQRLIIEVMNSSKLQDITDYSYIECINLRNKLHKKLYK